MKRDNKKFRDSSYTCLFGSKKYVSVIHTYIDKHNF